MSSKKCFPSIDIVPDSFDGLWITVHHGLYDPTDATAITKNLKIHLKSCCHLSTVMDLLAREIDSFEASTDER